MFAVILLLPLILLAAGQASSNALGTENNAVQPLQEYSLTTVSPQCDPTQYFLISSTPQIQILSFELNQQTYRPGETVSFSGTVQVTELDMYSNCYGQSYSNQNPASPTEATLQVVILGKTFQLALSTTGAFSGDIALPLSTAGGSYTATATAHFRGATDAKTITFTVEAYAPTLSITYPSTETQAHPGDMILLVGDGWIPNMQVLVVVDDNFTVSTDSSGHFSLQIPNSLDSPLSEGGHTITVEQGNLVQTTTLTVQYRTLLLSLSTISPISQGQNLTISGNVTTLETQQLVQNASVAIAFMGHYLVLQTNETGMFQTQVWVNSSVVPGTYTVEGNATRRGFRPSALDTETVRVLPASNVPLIAAVVTTGAVAGTGTSIMMKKVSKPKKTSTPKVSSASIGPGASSSPSIGPGTGPQASIGPGTQAQPKIGPGQEPNFGPGTAAKSQLDLGEIHTLPVPALRGSEFCIHCGLEIKRGSTYCSECGLRVR